MKFLTPLVIFSIVVLHRADFELNIEQIDSTTHAGVGKTSVTGSARAAQQQQIHPSRTVSRTKQITYATLSHGVSQTKCHNKVTDPVRDVTHRDGNTAKASHQKESLDNVATSHKTLNENAPLHIKIGSHANDRVNSPVSDVDTKVSTNVDNGDQVKHPDLKDYHESGKVQKLPPVSEVKPVDHQSNPNAVKPETKQLHNEPKITTNELQKDRADAESLQQDPNNLPLEMQLKEKIAIKEVGEQRTTTQKTQLEEKAIPNVQKLEQDSTAGQEDGRVLQQRNKEAAEDDRMRDLSSVDHLDNISRPSLQPDTSVDPVIPDANVETLHPVQHAGKSLNTGDGPVQPLEAATDATRVSGSGDGGKQTQETSVDKIPNKENSSEPSAAVLNATTSETSSNKSLTETAKSDEDGKSAKSSDVQPSSVQPPSRLNELSPEAVPSTAFVPGEVRSEVDSEQKSINELEVPNDMPSFDEWKQKEKEKSKHLEAEQTVQSAAPPVKVKGSKKRINYASVTCGAKVVGANQEAQNPSFILMENKDQYMINPCKVKKVFTVELCEPIQVQAIDIGNLELFSSLPQSFDVHVSDRFPSKEWKAFGRFHARDERTIQTFQVEDSLIFAKYIKIEMLSHYGQEHYCPLSILRVFGTTLDEDDDVEDNESENLDVLDEDNVTDNFAENKPTNLFASATDTVLSLVKTVLNPSVDTTPDDTGDAASLASSDGNLSSINSPGEGIKKMEPCTPEVNSGSAKVEDPATIVEGEAEQFQPLVPEAVVEASDQRQGDEENRPQFTITLIEVPRTTLQEILDSCEFCDDGKNESCFFDHETTCGYYRVMSFVNPQSCVTAWHNLQTPKPKITVESSGATGQLDMTQVPESEKVDSKQQDNSGVSTKTVELEAKEAALLGKDETSRTEKLPTSAPLESTTVASKNDIQGNDVEKAGDGGDHSRVGGTDNSGTDKEQPVVPPDGSIPASAAKDYHSADRSSESYSGAISQEVEATADSLGHRETSGQVLGQDGQPGEGQTGQIQMAQGQSVQSPSPEQLQTAQSQNKTPVQKPTNQTTGKPQGDKDDLSTGQGSNLRVIYAEASSKPEVTKDYELDGVPVDEITYQKLSSRGKESAFIKLKNRIKLLEVNLNLTNRYLEELSQRYKRQMEDMHSSLNKTIIKLSSMAKTAEERDVKQQDHIASLETTVENLTTVVTSVERSIESMQRQMIERHLCLMSLEILVFSAILIFCLNRRSIQVVESDHHPKTLRSEPSLPQSNGPVALRRKSADSQPSRDQSLGLWDQPNENIKSCNAVEEVKSHPPLSGAKTTANAISSAGATDFSKKRKKKKVSSIRSLSPSLDVPKKFDRLPSHSPATGLIFGTSFKDTLRDELVGRDNLRSHCKRFSWDSSTYKPWKWNIFGSNQDQKSSILSAVSCRTSSKLGRSEMQATNLSSELLDHRKNGLTKGLGLAENRQNEIYLLSANDTHNKFHTKKLASRGRPVAD